MCGENKSGRAFESNDVVALCVTLRALAGQLHLQHKQLHYIIKNNLRCSF